MNADTKTETTLSRVVPKIVEVKLNTFVEVKLNTKDNKNSSAKLHGKGIIPTSKSCASVASTCRICHEGESQEALISPCECCGTMGLVHISCLERWLSISNTEKCELCNFNFRTHRNPRPIAEWLFSRHIPVGRNGFCGDAVCLIVLTPLCLVSVYLCLIGAGIYIKKRQWEGVGLVVISICLLITYILWSYVTIRHHLRLFRVWQGANQVIHLVNNRVAPTVGAPGTQNLEVMCSD